ncbi:short-chain fatty acyl-CoA regulator family protein [Magnetovibrio sp. PR-2]|uniref:helix-turn-helix domain-containing protein n=1 Tax=Magnetovibrio sp. PR-2 TaxID=3120356 RepID=UPI002FCE1B9C
MVKNIMLGTRLRKLRNDRGLSQVKLADQLGISASYLNLIEHNRRTLTVPLLLRLSQILEVDPQVFYPQQENLLTAEVAETLRDPMFEDFQLSDTDVGTLVADAPELCQAVVKAYSAYRKSHEDLQMVSERLAQDPVISNAGYRLRMLLTSILSFSEILHDTEDLSANERHDFSKIVMDESENLSEAVTDMLGLITGDGLMDVAGGLSPTEAVTDYMQANNNHFTALEDAADDLRREAGLESASPHMRLAGYLLEKHGVTIETAPPDIHTSAATVYDEERRQLVVSRALPQASLNFHLALFSGKMSYGPLLADLANVPELPNEAARTRGIAALANYFAGACLMPYDDVLETAEVTRYDIDQISQHFATSFEQACHRLTNLRNPNKSGIPLHLIRVDVAGNISKRFSASGLRIPKYGSACPRWAVHQAFMTPGAIRAQLDRLPDGSRYFNVARTVSKPRLAYGMPQSHYSISIGCEVGDARRMIYSDGIDIEHAHTPTPVGIACRLCERADCSQRAAPPPPQVSSATEGRGRNISPGIGDV